MFCAADGLAIPSLCLSPHLIKRSPPQIPAACAAALNYEGFTTDMIITLAHNNARKNEGRRNNMGADASMEKGLSVEELNE